MLIHGRDSYQTAAKALVEDDERCHQAGINLAAGGKISSVESVPLLDPAAWRHVQRTCRLFAAL